MRKNKIYLQMYNLTIGEPDFALLYFGEILERNFSFVLKRFRLQTEK